MIYEIFLFEVLLLFPFIGSLKLIKSNTGLELERADSIYVAQFSYLTISSITYPKIWKCNHVPREIYHISSGRCGISCVGCVSLKQMIHLQWLMTASSGCGCRVSRGRCRTSKEKCGYISKFQDM